LHRLSERQARALLLDPGGLRGRNPVTVKSQLMGGMIWGVSAALHEETEIDRRTARSVNTNFADYLIAANADIRIARWYWIRKRTASSIRSASRVWASWALPA